jgi:hypothetical protein
MGVSRRGRLDRFDGYGRVRRRRRRRRLMGVGVKRRDRRRECDGEPDRVMAPRLQAGAR